MPRYVTDANWEAYLPQIIQDSDKKVSTFRRLKMFLLGLFVWTVKFTDVNLYADQWTIELARLPSYRQKQREFSERLFTAPENEQPVWRLWQGSNFVGMANLVHVAIADSDEWFKVRTRRVWYTYVRAHTIIMGIVASQPLVVLLTLATPLFLRWPILITNTIVVLYLFYYLHTWKLKDEFAKIQ
jgi:hypothetical protein